MWSKKYFNKIENARASLLISKEVDETIEKLMQNDPKNTYTLEIYKQVNELVKFSSNIIIALEKLDVSSRNGFIYYI